MKKKFALILTTCLLLTLLMTAFIACDNEETVTVKVYSVSTGHDENPRLGHTITIKKGSTFSTEDYFSNYEKYDGTLGRLDPWGFYLDSACTKKHNDDNIIDHDVRFYILYCSFGSKFIVFNYENEKYYCYVEDTTAKLTVDTFAVSAYGKTIDSSKLKYYSDEEMTQEIELVGKSYDEIAVEAVGSIPYTEKYVYVKRAD